MEFLLEKFFVFYLLKAAVRRVGLFLRHWYRDGFVFFWRKLIGFLAAMDYSFALRITVRHWLKPLYQDATVLGYILGPIFRTFRIIFGGLVYLAIFLVWLIILLIWLAIPAALLWGAIFGFKVF